MEIIDLIIDFHKDALRQGPGSDIETERALSFIDNLTPDSKIIDIGCGTGAQTLVLAVNIAGRITAIDLFPVFLEKLNKKLQVQNLEDRVSTKAISMLELPYPDHEFDLIWAEGSIYNIGFAKGLKEWRRLLKPGAYIAVSEISWLTSKRPLELERFWTQEYAEIDTISNKIAVIEANGYVPVAHFILPEYCWTENYYHPILERSEAFLQKYGYSETVKEFIEVGREEAAIYERFKEYYSYVLYIAKKV
jgi:ubiquinone/menaquinone biosynthesis C-methylase UbiE